MDSAAKARMIRRTPLGDRAESLAQIGHPDRPLGPEAAQGVTVAALPLARHLNLRVDTGSAAKAAVETVLGVHLPSPSTWCSAEGGRTVIWLGPDEWLVTEPEDGVSLESSLRAAVSSGVGAVTEQSGQRVSLIVQGGATGLLAKGAALDLGRTNFAPGRALQGYLAQAIVIFVAREHGIEVLVRSSFARYVADWLLDAAAAPLAVPASPGG